MFFAMLSKASPGLAAQLGERVFIRPRRFERPSHEQACLQNAQHFTVDTTFGKIAAWTWGKGPVVLLVHGWEGRGSQMGAFVEPLVAAGFRVITFDGPAHGKSSGSTTTLLRYATVVQELIDFLGPLHAVIAHSFGGPVTSLLLKSGLKLQRVVYIASPNDAINITKQFASIIGLSEHAVGVMRENIRRRYKDEWLAYANSWEELAQSKFAPDFQTPLLIFHDENDLDVPISESRDIAAAWPRAELAITRGLGHRRILKDGHVVERAVRFISNT